MDKSICDSCGTTDNAPKSSPTRLLDLRTRGMAHDRPPHSARNVSIAADGRGSAAVAAAAAAAAAVNPTHRPTFSLKGLKRTGKVDGQGRISNEAFIWKTDLPPCIILPKGVTSIGDWTFYGCRRLTNITLPEGLTSIGERAFYECTSLTTITLPEGLTSIGEHAFSGCISLTTITLPEGLTSIGERTFSGCTSLTNISLPEGLTSIGEYAFSGCTSLTSIILPEGVTSIGDWTFSECTSMTNISLPEGLTSIGESAFTGCISLTTITLPEGLAYIGERTFSGCTSLTNITVPVGMTSSHTHTGRTFHKCCSLRTLVVSSTSAATTATAAAAAQIARSELLRFRGQALYPVWLSVQELDRCRNITRVWAPDAVIAELGGPFEPYQRYADLPPAAQAIPNAPSWAHGELWLWWSAEWWADEPGAPRRSPSPARRAVVWTVLLIGERLDEHEELGGIPPEIWAVVLGFVRHVELPTLVH